MGGRSGIDKYAVIFKENRGLVSLPVSLSTAQHILNHNYNYETEGSRFT